MFSLSLIIIFLVQVVLANIEVIHFTPKVSLQTAHHLQINGEHTLILHPPRYSTLVVVNTTALSSSGSFTFKVSWSAAHPFTMVADMKNGSITSLTAVSYGVSSPNKPASFTPLSVVLTLDVLYMGILPSSILPSAITLLLWSWIAAYYAAPVLHTHIHQSISKLLYSS